MDPGILRSWDPWIQGPGDPRSMDPPYIALGAMGLGQGSQDPRSMDSPYIALGAMGLGQGSWDPRSMDSPYIALGAGARLH